MGTQHVPGHNNGVFLPRQMLEHVLSQNKSQIMPEHVLVMLAKTENRDFGLRQYHVELARTKLSDCGPEHE